MTRVVACPAAAGGVYTLWVRRAVLLIGLSWFLAACSSDSGSETETPAELDTRPGFALGSEHSCLLLESGNVYCWGSNASGQLGLPGVAELGKTEVAGSDAKVNVGAPVAQLTAGVATTCALLRDGSVKCWGKADLGELGGGSTQPTTVSPADLDPVPLGGRAVAISSGWNHTCATLTSGQVRCWGHGENGQLGNAEAVNFGDDEFASESPAVSLGGVVEFVVAGGDAACAETQVGLHCWGRDVVAGSDQSIGDDERVDSLPPLEPGVVPVGLAVGQDRACAWDASRVSCWGKNERAQLGLGDSQDRAVGKGLLDVSNIQNWVMGRWANCALAGGEVSCSGSGSVGETGLGDGADWGDDEPFTEIPAVPLGGSVKLLGGGLSHFCALLADDGVRCWGLNDAGQLGIGSTETVGDNETPVSTVALSFE
ncbi:MAG: hypothetical protein R3B07_01155 [Polyangiaceae bacterium]